MIRRTSSPPPSPWSSSPCCWASPTRWSITGIGQVAFPDRANGSPITVNGKLVGSKLIGQAYQRARARRTDGKPNMDADGNPVTEPDPHYFQPRPSQTGYNADGTFFSNLGPNQAGARYFYRDRLAAYLRSSARTRPAWRTRTSRPTR